MKTLVEYRKYICVIFLLALSSCSDINNFTNEKSISTDGIIKVENGRLSFPSKEILNQEVDRFKSLSRKQMEEELGSLYDQEFYPMRPVVNKNDSERMSKIANHKPVNLFIRTSIEDEGFDEDFDDFEELIGDDEYASVINNEGEIQVADSIYKYTDQGLYFVQKDDINHLYAYLETQDNTINQAAVVNSVGTNTSSNCLELQEDPGIQQIDSQISYFVEPNNNCGYTGGTGTANNPPSAPTVDQFIDNLPSCSPKNSRFSWLFGTSVFCTDKFDSKHRVKTKYWNQNYLLYRSIGVATKHQRKRFWIWWSTKTDEMRLGINQAYFEYNQVVPSFYSLNSEFFIYQGIAYDSFGNYLSTILDTSIPKLPFDADLEIVVNLETFGLTNYTLSAEEVYEVLYKDVIKQAKSLFTKWGQPMPDKFSLVGITSQKVIVNYVNKSRIKNDAKNIKDVFDWQGGFGIKLGTGTGGGFVLTGFTLPKLYQYNNVKIDIYGIAREGTTWKGNRFVFGDF